MSTYDDNLLAARFAALAPEPLAGDWDDVAAQAGRARKGRRHFADPLQTRHRRRVLVLAAVALVVVVGAASALAVRAVFHQGIVGLAPEGATPSTPTRGELVLNSSLGHTMQDAGRFDISVYADGRVIWRRIGGLGFLETGLLEKRLTPEGVALVKAEVIATGLFDHDLNLTSAEGLNFGYIDFRTADRRVLVTWGENPILLGDVGPYADRTKPTPEQASALIRLDARLSDLAAWLPASAWVDAEDKPFVPSGYTVCYGGAAGAGLSRLLELLPPPAASLLRAQEKTPQPYWNRPGTVALWCSELTNDEARALERILDDAGVSGTKSLLGLEYGVFDVAMAAATEFHIGFHATRPDR